MPFFAIAPIHTESAFHDACRTSSGQTEIQTVLYILRDFKIWLGGGEGGIEFTEPVFVEVAVVVVVAVVAAVVAPAAVVSGVVVCP